MDGQTVDGGGECDQYTGLMMIVNGPINRDLISPDPQYIGLKLLMDYSLWVRGRWKFINKQPLQNEQFLTLKVIQKLT